MNLLAIVLVPLAAIGAVLLYSILRGKEISPAWAAFYLLVEVFFLGVATGMYFK